MSAPGSNQFEYVDGQLRPTHAAFFADVAVANDHVVSEGQPTLDIPYGPHPRQTLDLFRTGATRRGVVLYFHAGYWQSRDKSGFSFLAPPLAADGWDVAIVNYPLAPETRVPFIVAAARASLNAVAALTGNAPQILAGHSAGAHLAAELGMTAAAEGVTVAGILAISGVFDLAPLIDTTLNAKLGLDPESARAASPLHRILPGAPPAIFAVGAQETAAFRDQNARMHHAWSAAANAASLITVPDADHFSVLHALTRDDGILREALRQF
jgi:arylformamidase